MLMSVTWMSVLRSFLPHDGRHKAHGADSAFSVPGTVWGGLEAGGGFMPPITEPPGSLVS